MHTTPDVLSLLALGEPAATPDEQTHLAQCPVCTAELEELSRVVDAARHTDPDDVLSSPRPAVWENIQREVRAFQTSPVPSGPASPTSPVPASTGVPKRRRAAYLLVAAVALVAGLGGGFALSQSQQPAVIQAARPVHLNALPSWPGAEGHAVVKDDAQGNRVLSVDIDVPEQPQGRMEVWLSAENAETMVSMGFMTGSSSQFPIPENMDISTTPVIDVSLEPTKDADPHHSGVSIVRGRIVR